jgi:hypothetical protein
MTKICLLTYLPSSLKKVAYDITTPSMFSPSTPITAFEPVDQITKNSEGNPSTAHSSFLQLVITWQTYKFVMCNDIRST